MSSFNKILSHPDKNTIVRMLTGGQGVRKVARYLQEKYPKDKRKHISVPTLQAFRKEKLNLEGEVLETIKISMREKQHIKKSNSESAQIRKLPAYKEKIKEIIDYHVDIQNELKELMILVKARIEDLFNKAVNGEITINEEANLQRYFQIVTTTIERWAKYVEKIADKTVETNVNITVIEDQMSLMREAIRETIEEMDPEMAIKFLDRLNSKITTLSYKHKKDTVTFNEIKDDAHMLTASVEEIENGG
jgi:hypothetical protein